MTQHPSYRVTLYVTKGGRLETACPVWTADFTEEEYEAFLERKRRRLSRA
jgi:hypothetical protein